MVAIVTPTAHIAIMVVAVSLTIDLASAESAKCIGELPAKRTEHWSYRIVNGQQCWYPDSERTTVGRKIEVERKAQTQKLARRSSPKVGLSRPPSATENEFQVAGSFAKAGIDRVIQSPKVDLLESLSTPVENKSRATASFVEVWNNRVTPRDPFRQIAAATSEVVPGGPTEAAPALLAVAAQRTASPPTSTTNFVGVMLWFGLIVGLLGMSLYGRTVWKKLRQRCNLVLNRFIAKKQQSLFSNVTIDIPN
jgi:hypothetical protein